MDHHDHVNLLRGAISSKGGVWADLGSGRGAFTLALADLIGPAGEIYSVDKDRDALQRQGEDMRARFPGVAIHFIHADFTQPLDLPALDGIIIANAIHYIPHARKFELVRRFRGYFKPAGRLVLVEYNVDEGNPWVPYPVSYKSWVSLARQAGFEHTRQLATHPSRFLREIYSAESW
jgi:ubiquinone/menaquinone biosynthesis C-methylase UbiE